MLKPTWKFRRAKLSTLSTNNKPNGTERNGTGRGEEEEEKGHTDLTGRMLISILLEEC